MLTVIKIFLFQNLPYSTCNKSILMSYLHEFNRYGGNKMSYYFNKVVDLSFDDAIAKVTEELKKEGFGVLTEIDVKAALKKKINVDFRKYRILGACNPTYAHKALQAEDKIGTMLPCNVIVQEREDGKVEIAAIDPVASMQSVKNQSLSEIATIIQSKLKKVIETV
jgi:uncharacterized protein (DUF302 family)